MYFPIWQIINTYLPPAICTWAGCDQNCYFICWMTISIELLVWHTIHLRGEEVSKNRLVFRSKPSDRWALFYVEFIDAKCHWPLVSRAQHARVWAVKTGEVWQKYGLISHLSICVTLHRLSFASPLTTKTCPMTGISTSNFGVGDEKPQRLKFTQMTWCKRILMDPYGWFWCKFVFSRLFDLVTHYHTGNHTQIENAQLSHKCWPVSLVYHNHFCIRLLIKPYLHAKPGRGTQDVLESLDI